MAAIVEHRHRQGCGRDLAACSQRGVHQADSDFQGQCGHGKVLLLLEALRAGVKAIEQIEHNGEYFCIQYFQRDKPILTKRLFYGLPDESTHRR
ncbi:hypothetical protein D3C71_1955960 [compost metagenome]